jgi:DNA-directed RNA polymerase specialized sigma24 family protein
MVENQHLSERAKQDLELVELARLGKQSAYAELMDRYRDSIYYMMLKMVRNADDADDLTIEAFGKASTMNPEESIIHGQKVSHMRMLVSKLKPRYRVLVEKRYFDELSYEEIAEELQLPLGTVKAQLFRARDFLANMMEKTKDSI